jgi:inorganic pyrophosphatase
MDPRSLPTWRADDELLVVIETPKGTPNQLAFDAALAAFRLTKVLPAGMVFPFDFGFIPGTRGGDGDPLDVLVLMDAPLWPGCVVGTHLLGMLEAEQEEDGQWVRNDRLLATARKTPTNDGVRRLGDLDPTLVDQIEAFFVDYNRVEGRRFRCLGRSGPKAARRVIVEAMTAGGGPQVQEL